MNKRLLKKIVENLNSALLADSTAINELYFHRISCNDELANHPTFQVRHDNTISCLGFLNCALGINKNGMGYIGCECDDLTQEIIKFIIIEENN